MMCIFPSINSPNGRASLGGKMENASTVSWGGVGHLGCLSPIFDHTQCSPDHAPTEPPIVLNQDSEHQLCRIVVMPVHRILLALAIFLVGSSRIKRGSGLSFVAAQCFPSHRSSQFCKVTYAPFQTSKSFVYIW